MAGPSFEVAKRVGTIVLGQIVVDEVCNKYKENLEAQVTKVKNVIQDLNKLLPESQVIWTEIDVVDKCAKYKDFLEMFIIESGMTVVEIETNETGFLAPVQEFVSPKVMGVAW